MENNEKKNDESVRAGAAIEADQTPITDAEKEAARNEERDLDEMAHLPAVEMVDEDAENDLDELVHEQGSITTAGEVANEETDADDAVHGG